MYVIVKHSEKKNQNPLCYRCPFETIQSICLDEHSHGAKRSDYFFLLTIIYALMRQKYVITCIAYLYHNVCSQEHFFFDNANTQINIEI